MLVEVRSYTVAWGSRSFDDFMWQAVEGIAPMKDFLPSKVERFRIEVRSSKSDYPLILLAFDRLDLEVLSRYRDALSGQPFN